MPSPSTFTDAADHDPAAGGVRDFDAEAAAVERAYELVAALMKAAAALDELPTVERGGRAEVDELLDRRVYPNDLGRLASQVCALADAWQAEIDQASPQ